MGQALPTSAKVMAMHFRKVLNIVRNRDDKQVSSHLPGPIDCKRLPRVCLEGVSEDATGPRGKERSTHDVCHGHRNGNAGFKCLRNLHR